MIFYHHKEDNKKNKVLNFEIILKPERLFYKYRLNRVKVFSNYLNHVSSSFQEQNKIMV